jgi:hypothetical protein
MVPTRPEPSWAIRRGVAARLAAMGARSSMLHIAPEAREVVHPSADPPRAASIAAATCSPINAGRALA